MPVHLERPPDHPQFALVSLDRPEKANALDPGMLCDLAAAWREIAADAIAANAPLAVRATRAGVRELLHEPLAEAYVRQEELGGPLRRTEDAREGQRAFIEKRPPV